MKKSIVYLGVAASATVLLVSACGGGGDSSGTPGATVNPFAELVGTWRSGCVSEVYNVPDSNGNPTQVVSAEITGIVSNPVGLDKATVSVELKDYKGTATCAAANLIQQATLGGQVTALAGTKAITGDAEHPKKGTAKTATFRFDSLSVSRSPTVSIPNLGHTNTVGYMLEDGKLYSVSGSRESDSIGRRFANVTLTRQ